MDTAPSLPPQRRTAAWILSAAIVVILGTGAWYALSKNGAATISPNVNIMTTNTQRAANANTGGNLNAGNANTNEPTNVNSVPITRTYMGAGFSVTYPADWSATTLSSEVVGLTPKSKAYSSEGSVAYPVSVITSAKSASDYLSTTPPSRKTAITLNGHAGFKVLDFGDADYFYIFTLTDGTSVSIASAIHRLVTDTASADYRNLQTIFTQILNSLTIT